MRQAVRSYRLATSRISRLRFSGKTGRLYRLRAGKRSAAESPQCFVILVVAAGWRSRRCSGQASFDELRRDGSARPEGVLSPARLRHGLIHLETFRELDVARVAPNHPLCRAAGASRSRIARPFLGELVAGFG